jgi:cytochrome d ubiquinol oxidase subunit I
MSRFFSGASAIMVALGLFFIVLFAGAFYLASRHRFERTPRVPEDRGLEPAAAVDRRRAGLGRGRIRPATVGNRWRAADVSGSFNARMYRQRHRVAGIGFVMFYSALAAVEVFLMVRTIRRGPDGLGYWPDRGIREAAGGVRRIA